MDSEVGGLDTGRFDTSRRLADARQRMAEAGLECLVVTEPHNIRWLSGFSGSNGWVVLSSDSCTLVTDGRYGEQAEQEAAAHGCDLTVLVGTTTTSMLQLAATARGGRTRVGFEAHHLSVASHATMMDAIGGAWVDAVSMIEHGRRSKDGAEQALMATAARIADEALAASMPMLYEGPTERQFRNRLEAEMRQRGADEPSFATIIAAGPNAAMAHHRPDDLRIDEGMTVVIDFGALYRGYHSDMTRTVIVGQPSAMQLEVYDVVLDAQQQGVRAVREGAKGREIDDVCRRVITAAGWGEWFTHGTGHGVGLQIHESPWLTKSYDDTLRADDVVTVEPGVYRRDFGGIRIEDMVVVTTNGCQSLTTTPKDSPCPQLPPMI